MILRRNSMFRLRCAICSVFLATVVTSPAANAQKTDTLVLYNGNHITGEISRLNRGKLSYKTDDMGTLSVEWDQVARLRTIYVHELVLTSGRRLFGPIQQGATDGLLVVGADTLFTMRIVEITPIEAGFIQRTHGYVDLGFTFAKANKATTLAFDWEANYRGRKWGASIRGSSYFQSQEEADPTSRNDGSVSTRRLLTGKLAILAFAGGTQNDELNLDLRATVGAGADFRLIRNQQFDFGLIGGALVNREQFNDSDSAIVGAEVTTQLDFALFRYDSPEIQFTSSLAPYFSVSQLGRVRIDFDLRLTWEVFGDFNLGITFRDNFDSKPPGVEGGASNDFTTTFSIGWSWN